MKKKQLLAQIRSLAPLLCCGAGGSDGAGSGDDGGGCGYDGQTDVGMDWKVNVAQLAKWRKW